jgi:tetratricopeptide (TPR) repeat protein
MKSIIKKLFSSVDKPLAEPSRQKQSDRARELHLSGDLDGAARLYAGLLEAHADDAELQYRFGNLQKDQGALECAVDSYDRAVALKPDYFQAYCNRAVALSLLHRYSDALDSYNRAISIDPTDSLAQCNRAMLLVGVGQKDAALAGFEAALQHDANSFMAHFGRGALLQERKQWLSSMSSYDRAIAINSKDPAALYNRALVGAELKRWDQALIDCDNAIALNPQFPKAHAKRALILQELKQLVPALAAFDRAIELDPRDATIFSNRGVLRHSMQQFHSALEDYDRAISLNPSDPDAWFNRGTVLKELGDLPGALAAFDRCLALGPDNEAAYVNRGATLQESGLVSEAAECYRKAIALKPDFAEAHYNLSHASLALGDFSSGWSEHEWRWHAKGGAIYREKRNFAESLWLGKEPIAGNTILLYAEQGLGDCLQFCRYAELVAKLGPRVVLEVPRPLVTLLTNLPGAAEVVAFGDLLPAFDVQCPLMSLPLAFGTELKTIPSASGYLKSDPSKVAAWRERLGLKQRPRVGLSWSGNRAFGTNRKRHFALSRFVPFLPEDFDYFCVQTDIPASDHETLEKSKIFRSDTDLRDFSDTAALCECMDLLISVDTSVAHLAAALGKPTWIMLAFAADWRWLTDRDDSPWYASARLFRQKTDGAWEDVFERVAAEMRVNLHDQDVPL